MQFKWDSAKAGANLSKHGVSFDEAKTLLDDPLYVDVYDPDHSDGEDRYIIIGRSRQGWLLIVSYTKRNDTMRIITSREITRRSEKRMKKVETGIDDEFRPEYDLMSLRVRKLGPGRKTFGGSLVRLEPDVAEVFSKMQSQ